MPFQLFVAAALAALSVCSTNAYAPPLIQRKSSSLFGHHAVRVSRVPPSSSTPQAPSSLSATIKPTMNSTERLDVNMDVYADQSDRRYSASDWWHNIRSLPNSGILREIRGPLGWITAWSTVVSLVHRLLIVSDVTWRKQLASHMCLGTSPHSLIASSIGLLLVFRTNSAYQKFLEGRKIWEQLLSTSRDLTRITSVYEREIGVQRKHRVQRLLAALPYLLHHHIQPRCLDHHQCEALRDTDHALALNEPRPIEGQARNKERNPHTRECWVDRRTLPWCLLPDSVLGKCAVSHNRPLWIIDRLSLEVAHVKYTDNFTSRERLDLLKHIGTLSACVGKCERIQQTAVPLNYARHALRSLTLWCFTLPFGLVKDLGLLTGPVTAVVAWLMFGVYQIGHTIEDPFQGSLRLTDMCNAIYRDVMYGDRNEAGMRRESAFRKDGEKDEDWETVGEAFGLSLNVEPKQIPSKNAIVIQQEEMHVEPKQIPSKTAIVSHLNELIEVAS